MRLPYLQVTQETWAHAKLLAGLTGVDFGRAFVAICDLWTWGLALGPLDAAPTGICVSPRAERLLAAALGWTGPVGELVESLIDVGLVERLPNGLRVRGMARYHRTWEKNRRKPTPKAEDADLPGSGGVPAPSAPVSGTNPAPSAPEPALIAPQDKDKDKDRDKYLKPPPPTSSAEPSEKLDPPLTPEEEVENLDWWGQFQDVRAQEDRAPEKKRPRNWGEFCREVRRQGVDPPRIGQGYRAFLRDGDFRKGGWPTAVFCSPRVWPQRMNLPSRDWDPNDGMLSNYR